MDIQFSDRHSARMAAPLQLTLRDEALHREAILRMRAQLFRSHSPADHHILAGTEQSLPPSISVYPAFWGRARHLYLGGLRYELDYHHGIHRASFSVAHRQARTFNFWLGWSDNPQHAATWTRYSFDLDFEALAQIPHGAIETFLGESCCLPRHLAMPLATL